MKKGQCDKCGRMPIWVNSATKDGKYLGLFCADCFDLICHDEPKKNKGGGHSGPGHNDPSFDNVIRAMEEDR